MDPMTSMMLVYLLLPLGFVFAVWLPFYMSVWSALYMVYEAKGKIPNPMMTLKYEATITMEQYGTMLQFWWKNYDRLSFYDVTLPLIGIPAIGVLVSIGFGILYVKKARDFFRVDND